MSELLNCSGDAIDSNSPPQCALHQHEREVVQIEWIPVAESLPADEGRKYLVASPGTVFLAMREGLHWVDVAAYRGGDGQLTRYVLGGITHWSELPSVPSLVRTITGPQGKRTS